MMQCLNKAMIVDLGIASSILYQKSRHISQSNYGGVIHQEIYEQVSSYVVFLYFSNCQYYFF